ncbi:RING-type domain-containing protein [Mycena indigotica]|uniref:RING-type domain-containing protein n=1 Tax=Mycena indigotica TaxID=2126181 RepID=A0A8H6WB86_9AGAR|nr:RING-type domain-containing protein [Mycena indigotica]KAF7309961.1 RING-type domain-containing protein [Mycena indigotica]
METDTDLDAIISNETVVISHPGSSQYRTGGVAACGLASLNFVRVVFSRVEAGITGRQLLADLLSLETSAEIISICSEWRSNEHLEVEEIAQLPLFEHALELDLSGTFGVPSFDRFLRMYKSLEADPRQHIAVVITRPPEIVACTKLVIESNATESKTVFITFDSHPRPDHPDGAGYVVNSSPEAAANFLSTLLAVDEGLLADADLQWQAQLLASFSGHLFAPKAGPVNTLTGMTKALMNSSLSTLRKQAEVNRLHSRIEKLMRDREFLLTQLDNARTREVETNQEQMQPTPSPARASSHVSPPSWDTSATVQQRARASPVTNDFVESASGRHPETSTPELSDFLLAQQMQMRLDMASIVEYDSSPSPPRRESSGSTQRRHSNIRRPQDARQSIRRRTFRCPLCLEDAPEDDVALLSNCPHQLCRTCANSYVTTKIADKMYPILCPVCAADPATRNPGVLTDELAQMLGLTDAEYRALEQLQMAPLSISIDCRKCKRSVPVDRAEYNATETIQEVTPGGPQHSCDGTKELQRLVARRGWKHCPTCKTLIQKSEGCDHITCPGPGCNTHFCYFCGRLIVRSVFAGEINMAVAYHTMRCQQRSMPWRF